MLLLDCRCKSLQLPNRTGQPSTLCLVDLCKTQSAAPVTFSSQGLWGIRRSNTIRLALAIEARRRLWSISDSPPHEAFFSRSHFLLVWCRDFIIKMLWPRSSSVAASSFVRVVVCLAIVARGVQDNSKGPCHYIIRVCEEETRADESHPWGGSAFFTQSDGASNRHLYWPTFSPPFLPTADSTSVVLQENWSFGDNWKHSNWFYEGKAEILPVPNTTEDIMLFLLVGRNLDESLSRFLYRVLPKKLYDSPPTAP